MISRTVGAGLVTDTHERSLYRQLRALMPALAALDEELGEVVGDMTLMMWQAAPRVASPDVADDPAPRVVSTMLGMAGVQQLRTMTVHDAYGSAYAVIGLRSVLRRLCDAPTRSLTLPPSVVKDIVDGLRRRAGTMMSFGLAPSALHRRTISEQVSLSESLSVPAVTELLQLVRRLGHVDTVVRDRGTTMTGQERSGRLEHLLPEELATLAGPGRLEMLSRLAEGQLRTTAREADSPRHPLVICVDASASMQARREGATLEAWAKALAVALAERALAGRQPVVVVVFGSRGEHESFMMTTRDHFVDQVVAMTQTSFGGGTDFDSVLAAAARHFPAICREEAAMVFISDARSRLTPEQLRRTRAALQARRLRTVAVTFSDIPLPFADTIIPFDHFGPAAQNERSARDDLVGQPVGWAQRKVSL